jgi:hypothetical protein
MHACESPVEDVRLAEVAEHDVRGLEIAMHDAALMGELHRETDIDEACEQRATRPLHRILRRQNVGERRAGEALHREVRCARVATEVMNRYDARMLEPTLHSRLAQEACDGVRIARATAHHLDGDIASDACIVREPHLTHAATSEQCTQRVALLGCD